MNKRRFLSGTFIFVFCLILLCLSSSRASGDEFPSKAITIIMPAGPGGGGDTSLRMLAPVMEKYLKVPVVIRNLPGAGGATGFTTFSRSDPDGYTLSMWYAQYAVSRQIFDKKKLFDINKIEVIGQHVTAKAILAVPKNSPFASVEDFKKAEKPVRLCTPGRLVNFSIATAALAKEMGFQLTFVTGYKGAAESIVGAMKGEGDAVLFGAALNRYLQSGDMRGILAFNRERYKLFPDIPTLKEKGIPESLTYLSDLNYVLWAPEGTPRDRIKIIEKAFLKATGDLKEEFTKKFFHPQPLSSKDTRAVIEEIFKTFRQYQKTIK